MPARLRGRRKLEHVFNPETVGTIVKAFKYGLSVQECALLLVVQPSLIEEFIRVAMKGKA